MKLGCSLRRALAPAIALVTTLAVLPATAAEFTADMHGTAPGGQSMEGRIWVKGERMRQEFSLQGQRSVLIVDTGAGTSWMVDDANRMYFEMQSPQAGRGRLGDDDPMAAMAEREALGTEAVAGHTCEKVRYTFHDPGMGTSTQWIAKDLDFPVKVVTENAAGRTVTEYTDIREGGVDAGLLQVPEGYRKMSLPGMGMGR